MSLCNKDADRYMQLRDFSLVMSAIAIPCNIAQPEPRG
jgi:hypothetical protein